MSGHQSQASLSQAPVIILSDDETDKDGIIIIGNGKKAEKLNKYTKIVDVATLNADTANAFKIANAALQLKQRWLRRLKRLQMLLPQLLTRTLILR